MRKLIAWPIAWALFWMVHAVSRTVLVFDAAGFLYPVYNNLMIASVHVQDWAGLSSPWETRNDA